MKDNLIEILEHTVHKLFLLTLSIAAIACPILEAKGYFDISFNPIFNEYNQPAIYEVESMLIKNPDHGSLHKYSSKIVPDILNLLAPSKETNNIEFISDNEKIDDKYNNILENGNTNLKSPQSAILDNEIILPAPSSFNVELDAKESDDASNQQPSISQQPLLGPAPQIIRVDVHNDQVNESQKESEKQPQAENQEQQQGTSLKGVSLQGVSIH